MRRDRIGGPKVQINGAVFSLLVVSTVSNLLMLTGPLFMLQIYDRVLASGSVPTLIVLTTCVCAIYGFYAFIEALRTRMALRIANVLDGNLQSALFVASVRNMQGRDGRQTDPVRDGDLLRGFLAGPGPLALLDLPWVPVYMAVVFLFHPDLGLLAVAGIVVITVLMIVNEALARAPAEKSNQIAMRRQEESDDARNASEAIIAMGMLGSLSNRWINTNRGLIAVQRLAGDRVGAIASITKAFRLLLQSLVLALGALLAIEGVISPGLMIAASIVTSRALAPVEQSISQWRTFVSARQAWGRIKKALVAGKIARPQTELPLPTKSLWVRNLIAAPPGSNTPLVQGISFELAAGDGMGVLGLSGSGKSSLVRAVSGVWPTLAGELRLDGTTLGQFDQRQLGAIIGYLPQRVDLLGGTVAENIARFAADAQSADIIEAARLAQVHDLIVTLPDGYDTRISATQGLLSAGQRQRIGLARALYKNPFLVVLDEPNSNLDADGDAALSQAITTVRNRGGIVIIVAHRPSAIVAVDKLLFLRNGRQMAFGPKKEVLQQISADNVYPIKAPQP